MKIKKKKARRSDLKILTKEGAVLKYLRESRKLSVRKAAKIVGLSDTKISHSENGRCDLNPSIILKCINAYGYSYEDFKMMLEGEIEVPDHIRSECVDIINRLAEKKLKMVKAFLVTL